MRIKTVLLSLALAFFVAIFVQSASAESGSSALQEDVVDEVNTSKRTLVIAGETFEVGSKASLEDAEGRSITLSEIRATQNDGEGDLVEYALAGPGAPQTSTGLRSIELLRVLGGDYE